MSAPCVVVTGGASGIGAATARAVVAAGGHVGLIDLNGDAATALAADLGPRTAAVAADAMDEEAMATARDALAGRLPPVTGLVACAGLPQPVVAIEDWPVADWQRVVDSHLTGSYIACRVFGPAMATGGRGSIVLLASVLAARPGPVLAYSAAKAGIAALAQSLAVHWAGRGVRVNAVAPGWTDTPFLRRAAGNADRDFGPIVRATPLGRLLRADEIAEVIAFLLSQRSSAVTGTVLTCDGGVSAAAGWFPFGGLPDTPNRESLP